MAVDSGWIARNLGEGILDAPAVGLSSESGTDDQALQRSLIDFDSEGPQGALFKASAPLASTGLSRFVAIDWPAGLAPKPGGLPTGESLPRGDVLVVTWTVDEGHALSRVLSPGHDSHTDWKPYTKNFTAISEHMRAGCPARDAGNLGTYWTTEIGTRKVTLFKSNSHMSQDGPQLANALVWKQIIEDVQPSWVISTVRVAGLERRSRSGT